MPPIGRLLGLIAAWAVGYAAENNVQLDESTLLFLMMGVYSAGHTAYRKVRAKRDFTATIKSNELPKGTL
jgi:hypothetical protein